MADLATLKTWLTEAETAFHQLLMGDRLVSISHEGRTSSYNQTNRSDLEAYIADLKGQIAKLEGTSTRSQILVKF